MRVVRTVLKISAILLGLVVVALLIAGQRDGAGRHQGRLVLQASAATVFPWLVDADKRMQWQSGLIEVRPLTGTDSASPGRPGSLGFRALDVVDSRGERFEMTTEVVRLEPPHLVEFRVTGSADFPFEYSNLWRLTEQADGTLLECVCEGSYGDWTMQLLEPVIALVADAKLSEDMALLGQLLSDRQPAD